MGCGVDLKINNQLAVSVTAEIVENIRLALVVKTTLVDGDVRG